MPSSPSVPDKSGNVKGNDDQFLGVIASQLLDSQKISLMYLVMEIYV